MSDNIRRVYLRDKDGNILSPITGGGGTTEGAISYEPQELTEAQQMQSRKNQGLYYKGRGQGEVVYTWDGDTEGLESVSMGEGATLFKVTEDISEIPSDGITSISFGPLDMTVPSENIVVDTTVDGAISYIVSGQFPVVVFADKAVEVSYAGGAVTVGLTRGLWLLSLDMNGVTYYTDEIKYIGETDVYHKIPSEYVNTSLFVDINATNSSSISVDKTFNEIKNAILSGIPVVSKCLNHDGDIFVSQNITYGTGVQSPNNQFLVFSFSGPIYNYTYPYIEIKLTSSDGGSTYSADITESQVQLYHGGVY